MNSIILCGPPFAGKSTVGAQVALKLRWSFYDTDRLLEQLYAKEKGAELTCREIHRREGEEQFRRYESRSISALKGRQKCVIALGGGALNLNENVQILKKLGTLFYLKNSFDRLLNRLARGSLPSYLEKEKDPIQAFRRLIEEREVIYELHADKRIEMDKFSLDQAIEMLFNLANKRE